MTRLAIAQMRMHNATNPGDPRLAALVGELSAEYPLFRQWWADHEVATRGTGTKHLHHPVVGDLALDWNAVTWAADPDLQIIVWTAEADSPSTTACGCSPPGPPQRREHDRREALITARDVRRAQVR